jgi:hypothetical protein
MIWLAAAWAHEPGLSRVDLTVGEVAWLLADEDAAMPGLAGLDVPPCRLGPVTETRDGDDGVRRAAPLSCPEAPPDRVALPGLPPGHRVLVTRADETLGWLDAAQPSLSLAAAAPLTTGQVLARYFGLGVEHILTGWDHLLFLTGLLLGVRTLREAALVVTGFTLSHSITLALAALGVIVLPASLVEPAIALTVVWVGIENLLGEHPTRRVVLTAALGLVHGLGFAGLLAELGLPDERLLPALLAFNGGVELGQFAVVLVTLPLLERLRALGDGRALRWASVGVSLVGLGWFVERVAG